MKKPKQCKWCADPEPNHWPFQCRMNPKPKKKIITAIDPKWQQTRREWFLDNPASFYVCYICNIGLTPAETTLDHVIPKSRGVKYKYDMANLRPCCWTCNSEKGSKVY